MWNLDYKESWLWRIDAFEVWCWRRLLRVSWTARRSNQSILKEISPGCSLEGLMLKLKLKHFSHLMQRADSLERTLMLGKIEGRRCDGWMASLTQWTWVWVDSESWWWMGRPGVLQFMGSQRVRHDWTTELNWRSKCLSIAFHRAIVINILTLSKKLLNWDKCSWIQCTSKLIYRKLWRTDTIQFKPIHLESL